MYRLSSKIIVKKILDSRRGEFVSQGELMRDARITYGYEGNPSLLLKRANELVQEGTAVGMQRGMAQLTEYASKVKSLEEVTTR